MAINETDFITMARELAGREFDSAVRYWTEIHFGEEIDAKAAAADQGRHVHLSRTIDGILALIGKLHPVYGTIFETVLGRIEQELFERDWAAAKADSR